MRANRGSCNGFSSVSCGHRVQVWECEKQVLARDPQFPTASSLKLYRKVAHRVYSTSKILGAVMGDKKDFDRIGSNSADQIEFIEWPPDLP